MKTKYLLGSISEPYRESQFEFMAKYRDLKTEVEFSVNISPSVFWALLEQRYNCLYVVTNKYRLFNYLLQRMRHQERGIL